MSPAERALRFEDSWPDFEVFAAGLAFCFCGVPVVESAGKPRDARFIEQKQSERGLWVHVFRSRYRAGRGRPSGTIRDWQRGRTDRRDVFHTLTRADQRIKPIKPKPVASRGRMQ